MPGNPEAPRKIPGGLDLIIRIAAVAFLLDDVIEFRAFFSSLRIFLPSPLLPFLAHMPGWAEWLFYNLHIVGLAVLIVKPRYAPAAMLVLAITVLRVFGDLLHLQPFVMMYAFTVFMAALPRASEAARLQALRLMVIGVYFWAGFNKINSAFYMQGFPWFIEPLWTYPRDHMFINLFVMAASLAVPVFEALIGVFLLFRRTRMLGTVMAFIMLLVVAACLGPSGHNAAFVVWPWNVYIFLTEMFLFLAPHESCIEAVKESWLARAALAIFVLAPALGIWGLWPSLPSFKLYSANVETARIVLDPREPKNRLPPEIVAALDLDAKGWAEQSAASGRALPSGVDRTFGVTEWLGLMNISPYFDERVLRTGSRGLCAYLQFPSTAVLQTMHPAQFDSMQPNEKDEPLCHQKNNP